MLNKESTGYYLKEVSHDNWSFRSNGEYAIYIGSFKEMVRLMVNAHHFELGNIDLAIKEMLRNDHNMAHFGMHRSFIYSCNDKELK